ncbi:MAG: histidinol-phosphate transaminase [Lachnospiraceae bacterium]|nr:histidinol-phosphate transaminase [Lachnospiraceae bacterium]
MSWEENVRRVVPYTPGKQPKAGEKVIKLNTNEFPYAPSPKVREALSKIDPEEFRLYPSTTAEPLTSAIADYYGFKADEVFVGVGSDDVLSMAFLTFFHSKLPVLFADITYSFYDVWAEVYGIPYETIPLSSKFQLVKEDYFRANGGIVIANPNAPTSLCINGGLSALEEILQKNPDSVVIIDEAYIDFGGETALPLIRKYDNLLVVRTFSKSRAFAGVRIGFAIGNKKLIGYLNDVKFSVNSYTMGRPVIALGLAALSDEEYFKESTKRVINTRERTKKELSGLGFNVLDSQTNFVFCSHSAKRASDIFEELKKRNIYVRYFNKPRIDDHLRITVGTDQEMESLITALKEILCL